MLVCFQMMSSISFLTTSPRALSISLSSFFSSRVGIIGRRWTDLIADEELNGGLTLLLLDGFERLEEVDLLLAGQKVDGVLANGHDRVSQLIAEQPGLQRRRFAVDDVFVGAQRRHQRVHIAERRICLTAFILSQTIKVNSVSSPRYEIDHDE